MPSVERKKIRVAIIGGSYAGCTVANGLLRYANIKFNIFDSNSDLDAPGAGVSLAHNAEVALQCMGLDPHQIFKDAKAVKTAPPRCYAGIGNQKPLLFELPDGIQGMTRTNYLRVLLQNLPEDSIHTGKIFVKITYPDGPDGPCLLHFKDQTTHKADVVIGCDGLWSTVRRLILQDDPDQIEPRFGGYWDSGGRGSPQELAGIIGGIPEADLRSRQVGLAGKQNFVLQTPDSQGIESVFIASAAAEASMFPPGTKSVELDPDQFRHIFRDWDDDFVSYLIAKLTQDGKIPVYPQWQSREAPTYVRGRLCMISDAAHGMLPWMGAAVGLATEDAAVLTAVLGLIRKRENVAAALQAFDLTRTGIAQYTARKCYDAAKLMTGQYGLSPLKIQTLDPSKWWLYLHQVDVWERVQKATALFNVILNTQDDSSFE